MVEKNVFFLSIFKKYVNLIIDGKKKWEFRQNPRFGILPDHEIEIGDWIFMVSVGDTIEIPCLAVADKILRGQDYNVYFENFDNNHWKESGISGSGMDSFNTFVHEILHKHTTAIKLIPYRIIQPSDVSLIKHKYKDTSWNGRGFLPVSDLKRYEISGKDVETYFRELGNQVLGVPVL